MVTATAVLLLLSLGGMCILLPIAFHQAHIAPTPFTKLLEEAEERKRKREGKNIERPK